MPLVVTAQTNHQPKRPHMMRNKHGTKSPLPGRRLLRPPPGATPVGTTRAQPKEATWDPLPSAHRLQEGPKGSGAKSFGWQPKTGTLAGEAGLPAPCGNEYSLSRPGKTLDCLLRVGEKILPQVEEFKYLGVLFTREGKMEREIDNQIGASAAMRTLHQFVVVRNKLSRRAKLSIYQSIFVPTLTYGPEL